MAAGRKIEKQLKARQVGFAAIPGQMAKTGYASDKEKRWKTGGYTMPGSRQNRSR